MEMLALSFLVSIASFGIGYEFGKLRGYHERLEDEEEFERSKEMEEYYEENDGWRGM